MKKQTKQTLIVFVIIVLLAIVGTNFLGISLPSSENGVLYQFAGLTENLGEIMCHSPQLRDIYGITGDSFKLPSTTSIKTPSGNYVFTIDKVKVAWSVRRSGGEPSFCSRMLYTWSVMKDGVIIDKVDYPDSKYFYIFS